MSSEEFSEDLSELERTLRSLRPASPQLDRDRLMFLAGQASAAPLSATVKALRPRAAIFWPSATAAMTLVSLGLGMTLALRPPTIVERVVQVPAPVRVVQEITLPDPKPARIESSNAVAEAPSRQSKTVATVSGGGQYLRLRDQAIAHGIDFVDSLAPVTRTTKSPTSHDSRQELLEQMLRRQKSEDHAAPGPLLNLLLNLGDET